MNFKELESIELPMWSLSRILIDTEDKQSCLVTRNYLSTVLMLLHFNNQLII